MFYLCVLPHLQSYKRADCICSGIFIILTYWIGTNIIQYLLYLVVLVSEYLSVFTQLYLREWGLAIVSKNYAISLEIQGPFMGEGYSYTLAWWGGSTVMTPVFVIVDLIWTLLYGATNSDWLPLSAKKNSLCLSHLVPEIGGHKVVLI